MFSGTLGDVLIRLGFHMSIAGSVARAPRETVELGFKTFQIFTTSARTWKHNQVNKEDAEEFKRIVKSADLTNFVHAPYLPNIASPVLDVRKKSIQAIVDNIENCNALGIDVLVVHMGSHLGEGLSAGIRNSCDSLNEIVEKTKGATIALENQSGSTNSIGSKFEDIGKIIDECGSERIGTCLDTCHAFAAGYDLRTEDGVEKVVKELDGQIGLKRLKVVHLNDSKNELGSTLDRHWHIGKGHIGREGFINFFKNKAFGQGSFIMETPINEDGDEKTNFEAASSVVKEAQKDN